MDTRTYLIDGSGYIYRAFYAVQTLSTSNGFPTNALFGFTRMLLKLIRDVEARQLAVAFDAKGKTFRHERYESYKATRKEMPSDLVPQIPYFRKIVEALGIQGLEKEGVEADDIIATIASRLGERGQRVVIVSGDKDLLQLVGGPIEVWDPMRDVRFTPEVVRGKFGVPPEQIRDYLALVGDSSDNVPGAKGIGPKTAERLLEHFGSVVRLLENTQEIETLTGLRGAKGVREKIESCAADIRLSAELVSLDTQVEPFNAVESSQTFIWNGASRELITPLFSELEFNGMLDSIPFRAGLEDVQELASQAVRQAEEKRYETVFAADLPDVARHLREAGLFAFDTETSSLDVLDCKLVGISFATVRHHAWYVPLVCDPHDSSDGPRRLATLEEAREILGPVFADPAVKKVGVNLKFDIGVLEESGFEVEGLCFDAMICSHVMHPDRRQHGLKNLAQAYLSEQMMTYEEMVEGFAHAGAVPLDRITRYACHDAEASLALSLAMLPLLTAGSAADTGSAADKGSASPDGVPHVELPDPRRAFEQIEMPLVAVLSRMERTGVKVDIGYLETLGEEFGGELRTLERAICECAGREFNLNSPKQLSQILFEELKLPTAGVKRTQSGYSTDANVLTALATHHEIARHLLEYRELHKLSSTYIEALKRLVHPRTGRIHTSFNQATAATGRLSSSEPNLQNIPIRNPRGRRIRRAFIADNGHVLLSADYSQIELRVLAHLSGDEVLQDAFRRNEDIHQRTGIEIFGVEAMQHGLGDQAPKDLRRIAKTINFGVIYGMGAFRLAGELGISRKQAQKYIDDYFARYPRVLAYFNTLREEIESRGYVETLFGRRRHAAELDTQGRDAGYTERSLLNAPLQGSAAEIIKRAMVEIDRELRHYGRRARMVLQVHDELVFEVDQTLLTEVEGLVREVMESAVPLDVPLKVDVRSGTTWGE